MQQLAVQLFFKNCSIQTLLRGQGQHWHRRGDWWTDKSSRRKSRLPAGRNFKVKYSTATVQQLSLMKQDNSDYYVHQVNTIPPNTSLKHETEISLYTFWVIILKIIKENKSLYISQLSESSVPECCGNVSCDISVVIHMNTTHLPALCGLVLEIISWFWYWLYLTAMHEILHCSFSG